MQRCLLMLFVECGFTLIKVFHKMKAMKSCFYIIISRRNVLCCNLCFDSLTACCKMKSLFKPYVVVF